MRHTIKLSLLLIVALIGVNWYVNASPTEDINTEQNVVDLEESVPDQRMSFFLDDRFINDKFDMGGVKMGMTMAKVRELNPKAEVKESRPGEDMLMIRTPSGMLSVWFFTPKALTRVGDVFYKNSNRRVYRLRQDQVFTKFSDKDVMKLYGRLYGRPIEAKCSRDQMGDTPRCDYLWWGGNGVELLATIKNKADIHGRPYTLLTTIATSTTHQGLARKYSR